MKDLYLATYNYGKLKLPVSEQVRLAKEMGFQGLEFLTPLNEEIAAALREYDMKVIDSMETPAEDGELRDPELLHRLGVAYINGTNLVGFGNRRQALLAAERLNRAGKRVRELGFRLYYHNHTHEWRQEQGEYLLETLLQNTDPEYVCLQMDAGWAACAGVDPVAFVKKYTGRVQLMHVKSSTGVLGPEGVGFMAPPPEGDGRFHLAPPDGGGTEQAPPQPSPEMQAGMARIRAASGPMRDCILDYDALMRAAEENGCRAFILERDEQYLDSPLGCICEDVEILRRFW